MVREDERINLLDRLISELRITCKRGGPDEVIFAGELLRDLSTKREEVSRLSLKRGAQSKKHTQKIPA